MRSSATSTKGQGVAVTASRMTALNRREARAEARGSRHPLKRPAASMLERAQTATFLEVRSVSEAREKSYRGAFAKWESWLAANGGQNVTIKDLDVWQGCVAVYLEELFWEGADVSEVATVVAAMRYFIPNLPPLKALPRISRAMQGFRKLSPAIGRVGVPWPMMCAILELDGCAAEAGSCFVGSANLGTHLSARERAYSSVGNTWSSPPG